MKQKKILVIDDEFPVRYLVEHHLSSERFDVHSAKDGQSGLLAVRTYQPDVILLDIVMPDMDGFEVCQEIRNDPEAASTPVIFLSARMQAKDKFRAFRVGGNDYLVKPFKADELLAHIEAMLQQTDRIEDGEKGGPAGRTIALFSPKGGVGTTTLTVQLGEAIAIRAERPVVLIDLDLPLGTVAPMLNMRAGRNIVGLLGQSNGDLDVSCIMHYAQRRRRDLLVIPAPDTLTGNGGVPTAGDLKRVLDCLMAAGYLVILDLGSTLTALTVQALRLAHVVYVITSGLPVANRLANAFMSSAAELGLDSKRLLPVVNELFGSAENLELNRVPIARIPHATDDSHTKMWLRDQGLRKLVSVTL